MRIVLVNTPSTKRLIARDMAGGLGFYRGDNLCLPPLDLAYMAATLLSKGHEVKIIDADAEQCTAGQVYERIIEYRSDIVIAAVSLPNLEDDCRFLKELRGLSSAKVIAKTSITFPALLNEVLQKSLADLCIYGESDITIDAILRDKDRKGTAAFKNGKFVVEENNIVDHMDELPLPARALLPNEKYKYPLLGGKVTAVQSSRGCPYPCAYYCPYPMTQGRKWRARSPRHVADEIEDIVDNYHIRNILFRDATFTFDKKRVKEICALIIERRLRITWWCETRIDCLDPELIRVMKRSGCAGMNIGVETGDPVLMEQEAKAGLTLDKAKFIIRSAQEAGVRLHFLLLIGLPGDTKRSLYKTYALLRDLKPETMGLCIITPYPGTPLYDEAKRKDWIEKEDWTRFGGHDSVMHTDNMSTQDLSVAYSFIRQGFEVSRARNFRWPKKFLLEYRFRRWIES